jgi:hypothetical protein
MFSKSFIVFATVLLSLCASVQSFSTGAAGCAFDPPIGGAHVDLSNGKQKKELDWTDATKSLALKVAGKTYQPKAVIPVPTGQSLVIEVSGNKIKGVLLRFEGPFGYNLTSTILPKTNTKAAGACTYPKVGITHVSAAEKPSVSGTLRYSVIPEENIVLTATVVFSNSDALSEYSYTSFDIKPCKPKACGLFARLFGRCKPTC